MNHLLRHGEISSNEINLSWILTNYQKGLVDLELKFYIYDIINDNFKESFLKIFDNYLEETKKINISDLKRSSHSLTLENKINNLRFVASLIISDQRASSYSKSFFARLLNDFQTSYLSDVIIRNVDDNLLSVIYKILNKSNGLKHLKFENMCLNFEDLINNLKKAYFNGLKALTLSNCRSKNSEIMLFGEFLEICNSIQFLDLSRNCFEENEFQKIVEDRLIILQP